MKDVREPLNAMEEYLYAIIMRSNIIIEQNNTIIEHLASKSGTAVTNNTAEQKTAKRTAKPKAKE